MITLKSVTMKNFMSVGNVSQGVVLDTDPLVLILGENRDLGGNGNRNGVGKSTIVNAITYALYGQALTKIKLNNLINKTNEKNMFVTLEFTSNNKTYKIERGRKPEIFNMYIDGDNPFDNDAQGSNRLTQQDVEAELGMSKTLFSHIVALNTFTEPFLSMKAGDQREMMELLLGMTKLSEKADSLRIVIKRAKEDLKEEEFRINGINDSNAVIQRNVTSVESKLAAWDATHNADLQKHANELEKLSVIDIDEEIAKHKIFEDIAKVVNEKNAIRADITTLNNEINNINAKKQDYTNAVAKFERNKSDHSLAVDSLVKDKAKKHQAISDIEEKKVDLKESINNMAAKTCPTCDQSICDDAHADMVGDIDKKIAQCDSDIEVCHVDIAAIESEITKCADGADAYDGDIESNKVKVAECESGVVDIKDAIGKLQENIDAIIQPTKPDTFYDDVAEAYDHKTKIDLMVRNLENEVAKINPCIDQLELLKESLQTVDYSEIEKLTSTREHQDFLLKLLTNKDSFIRKKIIDQNLSFLNDRLRHYLSSIGLPHSVVFNPNLDVYITEFGRDLDFDNLSRGEKTRLILSLSWAFRDVYESMNGSINLMFIDELLDSGLDTSGTEATLATLKQMAHEQSKNVMLISHREELVGKVDNIITVCKENGFTRIETSEL